MTDNYATLVQNNLKRLYSDLPEDLADNLPGTVKGDTFIFKAFGEACTISPDGISFEGGDYTSILGILITLYALNAKPDICIQEPFKAFKEFPDSMPYVGAFTTHTEQLLVPHVKTIRQNITAITQKLDGRGAPSGTGGDFAFIVQPMPKISLCYIFYEADEDFPASATCLYSNNAGSFLPMDGLADVGEYTSKKILNLGISST